MNSSINAMHPQTKKILQLLRLRQVIWQLSFYLLIYVIGVGSFSVSKMFLTSNLVPTDLQWCIPKGQQSNNQHVAQGWAICDLWVSISLSWLLLVILEFYANIWLIRACSQRYPNLKSVKELIYKRGYGKVNKQRIPLTENSIIEQVYALLWLSTLPQV